MNHRPFFGYAEALTSVCPDAQWQLNGDDYAGLVWYSKDIKKPTKARLDKEIARLNDEWDATEYRLSRKAEYPDLGEFADALYWLRNGDEDPMLAYEARVSEVKAKYPKPKPKQTGKKAE